MKKYFNKTFFFSAVLFSCALPCAGAVPLEAYQSFVRGLLAVRSGDVLQAISEYENVLELDGEAAPVYKDLALLYWQIGKSSEAFSFARKLEALYKDDVSTHLFLGSFYLITGQTKLANKAWENALKIEPENESAILHLAASHSVENEPEKAIEYWEKFIKQEPDSAEGYYQLGLIQDRAGNTEKARESFEKSISLRPDYPNAHLALAQIYERERKDYLAGQEYEKYLEYVPDNFSVLSYLGGLYYKIKNYGAAESTFQKAYKINSKDYNINFWLGVLAAEKKDWTEAIRYFEFINNKSSNVLVLTRLSYYYIVIKDYGKAVKYLTKLAKVQPDNGVPYYLLGLAYLDQKKFAPAEKNFLYATKLKPDIEDVHFHLGALYDQTGKFDKAVPEMEKAIEINPKYAPALNYLGYSYAERNIKLKEAEVLIKRAIEIEPQNGSFIDSLGWVEFRKGNYEESEKILEQAIAKLPDPVIWDHLGDVKLKLGKTADAWVAYRNSIDLEPKNRKVSKKIKQIVKLVLPNTLQRKVLKRAVGNLLQISSLKVNFSVYGRLKDTNFRVIGIFQYIRPELWRIDVLGNFMAPQVVIIQNKSLNFYPSAFGSSIPAEVRGIFEQMGKCFNSKLVDEFDSTLVKTEVKGGCYVYLNGGKSMLICRKTGVLKEYRADDSAVLRFRKYVLEQGLYLPAEIEAYFPKQETSIRIKLRSFILNQSVDSKIFSLISP